MSNAQLRATLRRLFDAIASEIEHNPQLARKLALALADLGQAAPDPPRPARRKLLGAEFHAVNTLRTHGEAVLRGRLEQVKAVEDLKTLANASGLVLSGAAARGRPSRAELIEGIVHAAKHYDEQRSAATA
jgi:hypothetical protein